MNARAASLPLGAARCRCALKCGTQPLGFFGGDFFTTGGGGRLEGGGGRLAGGGGRLVGGDGCLAGGGGRLAGGGGRLAGGGGGSRLTGGEGGGGLRGGGRPALIWLTHLQEPAWYLSVNAAGGLVTPAL
jgi:hypothetical protein